MISIFKIKSRMPPITRVAGLAPLALVAGCIAYAPSNTDWRKTPKVVVQVCSQSTRNGKAEIVLYRSHPKLSFGFDATYSARGRTVSGQEVFEKILEDPSPSHDAIGVLIHSEVPQKFYVFLIPERYSNDWSEWTVPVGEEDMPLPEVDRFKYQRGKKPLDGMARQDAPRIRTRLEIPFEYEKRSKSKLGYEQIPAC